MKKTLMILLMLHVTCGFAQKVDTLYYDQEWKGVDHAAFATYYKLVVHPSNPNYPLRAREFYMDGKMRSDCVAEYIDPLDDAKSKYKRIVLYHPNGNKSSEAVLENGVFHGICMAYYESGNLYIKSEYKNGIREGLYQEFTEHGDVVHDGKVENGLYTGIWNHYSQKQLLRTGFVDKGEWHGKVLDYDNGNIVSEHNVNHGVMHGFSYEYDKNGVIVSKLIYENGLPVGVQENRDKGVIERFLCKKVECADSLPIRISIALRKGSLATKVVEQEKAKGSLLGVIAAAAVGVALPTTTVAKEKYTHFNYFAMSFYNDADAAVTCHVSDVRVVYMKGDRAVKENSAMSQNEFVDIFSKYASVEQYKAEGKAAQTASDAATYTSNSYQSGGSYNYQNAHQNARGNAYAAAAYGATGAATGGGYGVGSNGYAAGAYGTTADAYGAVAAVGGYQASASGHANQYGLAYGAVDANAKDGFLEYQIYQKEKELANVAVEKMQSEVASYAENADYESFEVGPKSIAIKWVGVHPVKKYDKVFLYFKVNEVPCVVDLDYKTEVALDE